jgi:glycosyltransferase involved in cell wall biosynthesis
VNFEAMAASRPIIATRVGGIPEIVQDGVNGLLISVGDVAGFAQAILSLARDPGLAGRMGEEGRRIVERRFTNSMYAHLVSKTYTRILRPNSDTMSPPWPFSARRKAL